MKKPAVTITVLAFILFCTATFAGALQDVGELVDDAYKLANEGKFKEAEEHFRKDIEYGSPHARPYYYFGAMMDKQNNKDDALFHLLQALSIKPDMPAAHIIVGEIFFGKGIYDIEIG